jgi:tetratricopeptide (TPR) repeat protein
MSNPLLAGDELPAFGDIRSEHVAPALDLLLAQAEAALAHAVGPQVPANYDALMGKGNLYYNRGDYQTSIAVYRSAARAAPTNAMAQAYLGDAYFNLERFDDARTAYEAALRIDPQDVVSLSGMIKVLVKQGDVAGARARLNALKEIDPAAARRLAAEVPPAT